MAISVCSTSFLRGSLVLVAIASSQCTDNEAHLPGAMQANETDDDGSVPEKVLCDGSDALRLTLTRLPPHVGGAGGRWVVFPFEVGLNSIWVRGDCRYWIQKANANSTTQTLRTGVLSDEEATQLAKDMHYSQLDQFEDEYGDQLDGDGLFVLSNGQKAVRCRGYCTETPTAPDELVAMEARYQAWSDRLLATSEDVTGPMLALFTKSASPASPPDEESGCDLSWPFSFDPNSTAQVVTPQTTVFVLHRFEQPEAEELRQWWHRNIESPNRCIPDSSAGSFLIQEEDESWYLYRLSMRDSMPLEDADGQIPLINPDNQ